MECTCSALCATSNGSVYCGSTGSLALEFPLKLYSTPYCVKAKEIRFFYFI